MENLSTQQKIMAVNTTAFIIGLIAVVVAKQKGMSNWMAFFIFLIVSSAIGLFNLPIIAEHNKNILDA